MNAHVPEVCASGMTTTSPNRQAAFNPRPRVLYIDEGEDAREMLSTLLEISRIEARTVATAAQAFQLMAAERFDLYLLDTSLPDIDGFELCRQMRALHPQTPILFYSGDAYKSDKQKGIEAGANCYVAKPDVDGLVRSIASLVFPGKGPCCMGNPY